MTDALIEEYKALREETLLHIRLESQIAALAGTVFFLALAFLVRAESSIGTELWGVILLALITPLFFLHGSEVRAIAKISSYIEKCIEPRVEGLEWVGAHIESLPKYGKGVFRGMNLEMSPSSAISTYFLILVFVSWILSFLGTGRPTAFILLIMLIFSAINLWHYASLHLYRSYREKWEKIWEASLTERA